MANINLADLQKAAGTKTPKTSGQPDVPVVTKTVDTTGVKQLSVKVAQPNYLRLRKGAAVTEMSHQDILSEALELWLREHGF